jgi:hypothetical protein
MATFTKLSLNPSGGSSVGTGLGIPVTATTVGTVGTVIHTGSTTPATIDEVWIYAQNYDTTDRKLTIQWGGATAGTNEIEYTVKAESGLYLIVPGLVLQGNATARVVSAIAATATAIVLYGYVNRIA